MATSSFNNDNANFVNLQTISQIQGITDGDFLIVSTPNGLRIVDWASLNITKQSNTGGASFTDTVTAVAINSQSIYTPTLSADSIVTLGTPTITDGIGYFNRFTMINGLITSADYVVGSSEYNTLLSIINSTSSILTQTQPNVYVAYATISFPLSAQYAAILNFGTDPSNSNQYPVPATITNFNFSDFNIAYLSSQAFGLTGRLVINGYQITNTQQLSVNVNLGQINTAGVPLSAEIRVIKYY